ncbi:MAG: hypothetical protein K0S32_2432 [Bacteroidetes bacterium]|nr:hypothetical protein [Bacteroidota bacterium]
MKKSLYILSVLVLFSLSAMAQEKRAADFTFATSTLTPTGNDVQASPSEASASPSCNDFSVNLNETSTISVYSNTGVVVDQFNVNGKEKICFGKDYTQGIYLLRVNTVSFVSSTLLIKE